MNFKDLISSDPEDIIKKTESIIKNEIKKFEYITKYLDENDINKYHSLLDENDDIIFTSSIKYLTELITKATNKRPILLIDEYDAQLQCSYEYGYTDKIVDFYKRLYGETLKSNEYLNFSILTGISRIGKLSLFSGLNNIIVDSVIDYKNADSFGFTIEEINNIINYYKVDLSIDKIIEWYGGYKFGNCNIINPWSFLNYINYENRFKTYWNSTSSPTIIKALIKNNYLDIQSELFTLLNHQKICIRIDDSINYEDINTSKESIISYLLFLGYLTYDVCEYDDEYYYIYIPNIETYKILSGGFKDFILGTESNELVFKLKESFMNGNEIDFANLLEKYLLNSLSYYDFNSEKNYSIMLLTLFSLIFSDSLVKSEVNSGDGRCDISIMPKNSQNNFGAIIEIKHLKTRTTLDRMKITSEKALEQIIKHECYDDLLKNDTRIIYAYGIAFL